MRFRGKIIDPVALWSNYCEIKDEKGPFLTLTFCPNPDHLNSRTPAFQINVSKPMVHCFSHCGISGSYEHAVCVIEGFYEKYKVDLQFDESKASREQKKQNRDRKRRAYREARKLIYQRSLRPFTKSADKEAASVLRKARLSDKGKRPAVPQAAKVKKINLGDYSYLPKEALSYLERRGIDQSARARWQIGFDEAQERVTIPVRDQRDRLQFLIRRAIYNNQRPSYLYSDESLKTLLLFGACNLDRSMVRSEGLIIVEGSIDCIRLHQHGYINTVSILGAYISDKQRDLIAGLQPKKIYLFFDKDAAGVRAVEYAAKKLKMYPLFVPLYPKLKTDQDLDPAALTKRQVERAITAAVPVLRVKQKLQQVRKGALATRY